MKLWQAPLIKSLFSLALFGAAAFMLALDTEGNNFDLAIVRIVFVLPILLTVATIAIVFINLIATFIGAIIGRLMLVPKVVPTFVSGLVATISAWAVAAPPGFGWKGHSGMLRAAFALSLAVPWVAALVLKQQLLESPHSGRKS